MNQNGLIALLRNRVVEALAEKGWADFEVSQKFQPTQQGVPVRNGVFIQPMVDYRHGFPGQNLMYNSVNQEFDSKEPQVMETPFQISVLSVQEIDTPEAPTSADVSKYLARALSSQVTVEKFMAQNVGILRIKDSRNDPFLDDRDRSEYHSNFDITLTHVDDYDMTVPQIDKVQGNIYPVQP